MELLNSGQVSHPETNVISIHNGQLRHCSLLLDILSFFPHASPCALLHGLETTKQQKLEGGIIFGLGPNSCEPPSILRMVELKEKGSSNPFYDETNRPVGSVVFGPTRNLDRGAYDLALADDLGQWRVLVRSQLMSCAAHPLK